MGEKIESLTLDQINLSEVNLPEALEYLAVVSRQLDGLSTKDQAKGVDFQLQDPDGSISERRFSLQLREVPFSVVLDYVCELAGCDYRVDPWLVVVGRQVPRISEAVLDGEPHEFGINTPGGRLWRMLEQYKIPTFEVQETSVSEALELLRTFGGMAQQSGHARAYNNFVLLSANQAHLNERQISFKVRQAPIHVVLDYLCRGARLRYQITGHSVMVYAPKEREELSKLAAWKNEPPKWKAKNLREVDYLFHLQKTELPQYALSEVTLEEAISYFQHSTATHYNVINHCKEHLETRFTLCLQNTSLYDTVRYFCALTGKRYEFTSSSIILRDRPSVVAWRNGENVPEPKEERSWLRQEVFSFQ